MAVVATTSVEGLINLVRRMRDYVNDPRIHAALFAEQPRFVRACSAMDMIEDTAQALRSYLALAVKDSDHGTSYLVVFGALQVLYVQQDAVFWLCECLGFPRDVARLAGPEKWIHGPGNDRLSKVRSLRNSSIGHPVWRNKGPESERGSYFIIQMSLSTSGFQLAASNASGDRDYTDVDIPHLVNVQVQELEAVLKRALEEISEAERAHRERFTGQRLEMTFAGLSHPIEKMHQAVREETFRPVGMYGVEAVQRSLHVFRERLAEHGEPFREDLEFIYGQLNTALSRLTEFYNRRQDDHDLADILATFVGDRINELRDWARSLDEDYELSPVNADLATPTAAVTLVPRPDGENTS
jgi:hypothetical protein